MFLQWRYLGDGDVTTVDFNPNIDIWAKLDPKKHEHSPRDISNQKNLTETNLVFSRTVPITNLELLRKICIS